MHTAFETTEKLAATNPVISIEGISVRYHVPKERILSFKEYAIRWIKRQIQYQEFWALHDVSLEIFPGEVIGIVGPNGAGKSTLLKVVARVLKPTSGRVRVRGRVAPLLELGAGFDPELTGRENIYLNGTILGFSKREIDLRLDDIVEFSGLRDFIDTPMRTYSSGMWARLGFAVATAEQPETLIIDEILGVGDAEFQTKSFERIQSFQALGTTILLVSHDLARVEEMCSRAMWLDHGRVVALGSPRMVIGRYLGRTEEQEAKKLAAEVQLAPEQRLGNQKVEISRVQIKNIDGVEQRIFRTGEKLVLQIDYVAHQPIPAPIFGIAIHRQDGTHVTGPNTSFAGLKLPVLEGPGSITYAIPYLPLLEGLYHFSVAVVNQDDSEIFDYHDRAYPFRVVNIFGVQEKYGLITLQGEWKHHTSS